MLVSRKTVGIGLLMLVLLAAGAVAWQIVQFYRAQGQIEAAERALDRRDFAEANGHLKKCLDARPQDASVRLLLAQAARRQGNLAEAERHLDAYKKAAGPPVPLEMERRLLRTQRGDVSEAPMLPRQAGPPEAVAGPREPPRSSD